MLQIVDRHGALVGEEPKLSDQALLEMYRLLLLSRQFDRKALALQRQGRIGTYAPAEGQEAVPVGSGAALGPEDWVFPSYREPGLQIARGVPLATILSYWRGLPNQDWDVRRYRTNINTIPIATHLPHAVGHAYASRLAGADSVTTVYFGDGATSESDFHAGLNFAGVWKTPNVFICANNLWAISVPLAKQTAAEALADKAIGYGMPGLRVDGMDVLAMYSATAAAVERARQGEGPTLIEALTYRFGPHATADDPRRYRTEAEEQMWRDRDPIRRFERYMRTRGLWDATLAQQVSADVAESVDAAIEDIEARKPPAPIEAIRHVYSGIPRDLAEQFRQARTDEGMEPAAIPVEEVWAVGRDQPPAGPTEPWTMAEAITAAIREEMIRRPETVLLGEDVAQVGGVFRITDGLLDQFGPERVIDTPLSETGIVGTAIGMAMAGARPIAEIQFDGFVYPAMDQMLSHLARMRFRTRGNLSLPVVVRWPNGGGIGAHEFHGDSPETYFVHTPGIIVVVPSTPTDAKGLLAAALASEDPVVFLEPKVLYRAEREPVPVDRFTLPIGRARRRRPGRDVTVVTYGGMVPVALAAAEAVAAAGRIDCDVIDLRTLSPWDKEMVLDSVAQTGRLVLVQEPARTAGIAAEIAATAAEEAVYDLRAPIIRVAGFDAPWPQFAVEHDAMISQARVAGAITRAMVG